VAFVGAVFIGGHFAVLWFGVARLWQRSSSHSDKVSARMNKITSRSCATLCLRWLAELPVVILTPSRSIADYEQLRASALRLLQPCVAAFATPSATITMFPWPSRYGATKSINRRLYWRSVRPRALPEEQEAPQIAMVNGSVVSAWGAFLGSTGSLVCERRTLR
jgi:hypothetical protein